MKSLRRHFSLIALVLAWSSWLSVVAEGPKVLCIEGESQIRVESAASICCIDEPPAELVLAQLQGGDDCNGCEDTALNLVARSREVSGDHEELNGPAANVSLELTSGTALVFEKNYDCPQNCHARFERPITALHVMPGTAPQIC